jgi:hypothetical protein
MIFFLVVREVDAKSEALASGHRSEGPCRPLMRFCWAGSLVRRTFEIDHKLLLAVAIIEPALAGRRLSQAGSYAAWLAIPPGNNFGFAM